MPNQPGLYRRKPLNEITAVPDSIISVYVAENHIWAAGGTKAARAAHQVERRTIEEFLIQPVRPSLRDILRQVTAPYAPGRKDTPIGPAARLPADVGERRGLAGPRRRGRRTRPRDGARGDVEAVVIEFRRFLLDGLAAGEDELPVMELE
ncbi:MAG: hypothetical protein AUK03_02485 [Anaerolineae bacterium CG2_30_64_16]|nr:MAG: hypothetical protein AUK03_02485 [Anaerolineae bacterium CG2_30_64_16]